MSTDREILEDAAKAAGYIPARMSDDGRGLLLHGVQDPWGPLTDDGDCARMEAACGIDVSWCGGFVKSNGPNVSFAATFVAHGGDKNAARRFASTYVAAAMAKGEQ